MKSIKKNIITSMVLLLPLWFVACESEREVGSTLFPEENSGDIVKAFIDNRCFYPKNYMESTVVQTGNGGDLIAGSEQVDLRVQLTNAAPQDLVFSMKVENSVSDAREDDVTWLGEDAISFLNQTVTIKKGELESEEMISFTLDEESGSLKELAESGMVALSLVTTDAVEISENYSTYLWKVNKEITNIDVNGSLKDKTMIDVTSYDVIGGYGVPTQDLSDDNMNTSLMSYIGYPNAKIPFHMHEPQEIIGLSITPAGYWGAWNLDYSKVELLGGDEPDNLTRIGIATCTTGMPSDHTPWEIAFYSPIKVRYLTVHVLDNFSNGGSINALCAEIRLYR